MRRIVAAAGTLLLAGTAAAIGSTGSASAATAAVPSTPILLGSLHLTKTDDTGATAEADLTCLRGRTVHGQTYVAGNGTVTDPTAACQELAAAGGDFGSLNVHPTWLTSALYAPVSVTATGWWGASSVGWGQSYGNRGALAKYTGDVFAF